jgi:predicted Ser/Thr protein kinase
MPQLEAKGRVILVTSSGIRLVEGCMNETETNPNMEQKCPQCGAPLPSGVLAGLCPACLMKQGAVADTAVPPETASFQPPSVEEIAKLFPQLEILALIGKGGMGAVYQARQPALDRIVALKILPPQTAGGPGFVERFNREARALAKLNHPNIVAVYEFGQVNGLPFFIMEFVDGLNLRQLERAGKLSPREALQIVPQICEALQFAHDEGIVHRDIKPENILLDKKGRVKIADFGIAKILGNAGEVDLTGTQGAIGTPHYMAPEQMEKPTAVDHRADIFSLGVVFYEMLTGELPLGKFAPPSSRKVEVDVRLDDVVLRTLEKDPERRYQHASQVKTAVDTIAGSAAPPQQAPAADAAAIAKEILNRDYTLNIRSCLRRGWNLLKGEFWPFVGITALIIALLGFASSFGGAAISRRTEGGMEITSGTLATLVWGPLMGGLWFYFIKKIRRESATVETAFCGFSKQRFLHLFLAGFVTSMLTWLGFLCLILPGIYLLIAWMFTLPLVMDKQLDFWSAMELSRKVVTKHWFKFFGFGIVMMLLTFAGVLALVVGVFVMSPLILGALMYAYEDVFGGVVQPAAAPAAAGPSGTVVMPMATTTPPRAMGGSWTLTTKIGLAAAVLVIGMFLFLPLTGRHSLFGVFAHKLVNHAELQNREQNQAMSAPLDIPTNPASAVETALPVADIPPAVFGPVTERVLTNFAAVNLVSENEDSLPASVTQLARGPQKDSVACAWLQLADMDFAFVSAYDGFYGMVRNLTTLPRDSWDKAAPAALVEVLRDSGQDIPAKFGNLLNNPTNYTYGFRTRAGLTGLLQVVSTSEGPPSATIRYKFVQPVTNGVAATSASKDLQETLSARLEAASSITEVREKDKSLAAIASAAAKLGQVKIAGQALSQMFDIAARSAAARQAALLLAKSGFRKEAVEMAKDIGENSIRDQTLSELAQ